jgi:hypothetical protein
MHPSNRFLKREGRFFFRPEQSDIEAVGVEDTQKSIPSTERAIRKVTIHARSEPPCVKVIPFHTASVQKTYWHHRGRVSVFTWENDEMCCHDLRSTPVCVVPAGVPHAMMFESGSAKFFVSFQVENPPVPTWLPGCDELLKNAHCAN